jgi:NTP pyrophosphatase (non-canonical NTP hydrolase)
MDSKTYEKEANRTVSRDYTAIYKRLVPKNHKMYSNGHTDLLHAAMGLTTESGEFMDALKKHVFYGKPLDKVNLKEEVGDLLWYCALALHALDSSFEEVMATNIAKLKARYPDKFEESQAINRDLDKERGILEK